MTGVEKTFAGRGGAFALGRQRVRAVAGVSLEVPKGRSLALVGESGSGKSTLARCIVGLERADRGAILLEGSDIAGLSRARLRPYRKALQMVFQDPFASLNPRWRVGDIIAQGPDHPRHAAQGGAGARRASCCAWSGSIPRRRTAIRTSSPVASASASASPARWP